MAMDVYVGPLARYHAGLWNSLGEQTAETLGSRYAVVRPGGSAGAQAGPDVAIIEDAVVTWRAGLSEGLAEHLDSPLSWQEGFAGEVHTDRPGWEGYAGLLLWAAHEEQPQLADPRGSLTEDWAQDPAYLASTDEGFRSRYSQLLYEIELWLPVNFSFTFRAEGITGDVVGIASTFQLLDQLRELNRRTWEASREVVKQWRQAPVTDGSIESAARFGYSIFLMLAEVACRDEMPMVLDY